MTRFWKIKKKGEHATPTAFSFVGAEKKPINSAYSKARTEMTRTETVCHFFGQQVWRRFSNSSRQGPQFWQFLGQLVAGSGQNVGRFAKTAPVGGGTSRMQKVRCRHAQISKNEKKWLERKKSWFEWPQLLLWDLHFEWQQVGSRRVDQQRFI